MLIQRDIGQCKHHVNDGTKTATIISTRSALLSFGSKRRRVGYARRWRSTLALGTA